MAKLIVEQDQDSAVVSARQVQSGTLVEHNGVIKMVGWNSEENRVALIQLATGSVWLLVYDNDENLEDVMVRVLSAGEVIRLANEGHG